MSSGYWRINPVAVISSTVALVSVFLPWWGIYELFGSTVVLSRRWDLWAPPGAAALRVLGHPQPASAAITSQIFTWSSLVVLTLSLVVAALALAGGLTLVQKYLAAGLAVSILTPVAYAAAITYITGNYCLTPLCASGSIGSRTFAGTTFVWGFETGFYTFIAAIIVLALALFLNNSLARPTTAKKAEISVPATQSS